MRRHNNTETIPCTLHLGENVKMIVGDRLTINNKIGEMGGLITKLDGSARIFLEHKYEIVKLLQD